MGLPCDISKAGFIKGSLGQKGNQKSYPHVGLMCRPDMSGCSCSGTPRITYKSQYQIKCNAQMNRREPRAATKQGNRDPNIGANGGFAAAEVLGELQAGRLLEAQVRCRQLLETGPGDVLGKLARRAVPGSTVRSIGSPEDAIAAAGGVLPNTDLSFVNLARKVADGELIVIGIQPSPGQAADPTGGATSAAGGVPAGPVDINTAGLAQLETLPGIGPALAQRIVDYRDAHGPLKTIEDSMQV